MIGTRDARFRPLVLPSSGTAGVSLAPRISRGQDKISFLTTGALGGSTYATGERVGLAVGGPR